MTGFIVIAALIAMAVAIVLLVDRRDRRHRAIRRPGAAVLSEAVHHRADINAVPYEPARHAGQRDWATYRRRDRKRQP